MPDLGTKPASPIPDQTPFVLTLPEVGLRLGDTLLPMLPESLALLGPEHMSNVIRLERAIFGFRIPYLPDFLTSLHLPAQRDTERLGEILRAQAALLSNLHKWRGVGFSLRYLFDQKRRSVDIALLVGATGKPGFSARFADSIASDLYSSFISEGVPLEPISEHEELSHYLKPFTQPALIEVRQREQVLTMQVGAAYVVYPFRAPTTTWISLFEKLLRLQHRCLINVHVEPTVLTASERQSFTQAAALAESTSNIVFEGLSGRYHFSDPQARLVGRLYVDYLERLAEPFLLVAQVLSDNIATAHAAAQAFGAEATIASASRSNEQAELPTGFKLVEPQGERDLRAALRTLEAVDLQPWQNALASEGKERLPYLVDARTATAAFRFPIAVRGGIPGVTVRQRLPNYEGKPMKRDDTGPAITLGRSTDHGAEVTIPLSVLTRHVLLAGTTGSGKTTTAMQLLAQVWEHGVPFLVIEPAKREYRALIQAPLGHALRVFTLGDETVSPFRLNPFELLPDVSVESHISALQACFQAALPTFGILPSLLEESLHNVYLQRNWNLTDKGADDDDRIMPTMADFYFESIRVSEQRGYSEKTGQDIRAAVAGRIGSLLRGSKGRMLNTRRSIAPSRLFTHPTVLELDALSDEDTALVMLFLLTFLREHCHSTRSEDRLQHVTLIEEAHRVMGHVPHAQNREVLADSRAEAVSMFSSLLSEVRAYGEGIIVAEQIPGRLAEDALKNTNLKIVHCLPGGDDRRSVGDTMNLAPEQEDYLAKLRPGQAALSMEGSERPTFVVVHDYRLKYRLPKRISDEQLRQHMATFRDETADVMLPFEGCAWCLAQCQHRDRVAPAVFDQIARNRFFSLLAGLTQDRESFGELVDSCRRALHSTASANNEGALYCYFTHLWPQRFPARLAERLRAAIRGGP
jgi:hypothetical protein